MLRMARAKSCASPDDLLNTAQVAEMADVDIATVNRWASAGRLAVAAQANGRLYRRGVVEAFIAARKSEPTDASAS